MPATADLLAVVAGLPQGRVVLPGLDSGLDDDSWAALGETHPQFGMAQLLERLDVARADVLPWGGKGDAARLALAREVMRPEATAHAWADLRHLDAAAASDGLSRIECDDSRAEAGVIALLMRETLETPGRTAALVTPDRDLARRVRAELGRWDIAVDDSAGRPLAETMPGTFLRLSLDALQEDLAPVPLLSLLKHPLAAGAEKRVAFRARSRELERACLRGPRPGPGFAGLRRALGKHKGLRTWLKPLEEAASPLLRRLKRKKPVALADLVREHLAFAEWLASDDLGDGANALWQGEAGHAAATLFEQLLAAAEGLQPIAAAEYPALIEALLARAVVRPRSGVHPRLAIWGPLEARLQHADRIILGGLVEASWPGEVAADPWLSRPMRKAFGLPLPERAVGLAAHDFAQLFCAPEAVLTRAQKAEGTPTVPSRWLVRLDTVLDGAGGADIIRDPLWMQWHTALDMPDEPPRPLAPPEPCPPVAARPRKLSVTRIERWMRDPYDIYARHILGLSPLDPIDAALGP
ncbi:MAG: double-strand break repair protein AddB, partial [Alphaproteobacteria bacterium]|nr:double-strand break repair protein AddB [Alphaproteobacteria bacterium]